MGGNQKAESGRRSFLLRPTMLDVHMHIRTFIIIIMQTQMQDLLATISTGFSNQVSE